MPKFNIGMLCVYWRVYSTDRTVDSKYVFIYRYAWKRMQGIWHQILLTIDNCPLELFVKQPFFKQTTLKVSLTRYIVHVCTASVCITVIYMCVIFNSHLQNIT